MTKDGGFFSIAFFRNNNFSNSNLDDDKKEEEEEEDADARRANGLSERFSISTALGDFYVRSLCVPQREKI
jgi:hypothetical protein